MIIFVLLELIAIVWCSVVNFEAPGFCFTGVIFDYEVWSIVRLFDANELGNNVRWDGISVLVNNAYNGIGFISRFLYFPVFSWIMLAMVAYLVGGLIGRALVAAEE